MPKLNAPAEIHWRRSNMNTQDPILMKSVEVLKDCRSLNAAAEMNCPMPRSVEKVPIRNEKRCITPVLTWQHHEQEQGAGQQQQRRRWRRQTGHHHAEEVLTTSRPGYRQTGSE